MSATQVKERARRGPKILLRVLCLLAVGTVIAWTLNRTAAGINHEQGPAGLGRGMLQGALMPLALPNLVLGNDVTIYSPNNTGRTYKLGYTLGVNLCGLLFFGIFFWRVSRWRKGSLSQTATS
ncbi:MAG TPA: hypothetical protein VMZ27_01815 [Candidatus Saccharimonadales bacterium]|nr:hypothetical protein [Candidatus Saccharimonadales bacterium]